MKIKPFLLCWSVVLSAFFMCSSAYGFAHPPVTEQFNSSERPVLYFDYATNGQGRITVAYDETDVQTNSVPDQLALPSYSTASNRIRGNKYRCDKEALLTGVGAVLGRSQDAQITFFAYESATSNGTFSLVASNTVTAAGPATNRVFSGAINLKLVAGYYYLIGASWPTNAMIRYTYGGTHPAETDFGETIEGYVKSSYPPAPVADGSSSSSLYWQLLVVSTNGVVRLDDAVNDMTYSTNKLILQAGLAGYTNAMLEFRHRELWDDAHAEDGIFLATNSTQTPVRIFNLDVGDNAWRTVTIDLAAAAASNSMILGSNTYIVFQQMDNYGVGANSGISDGREFDDIRLYSTKPDLTAYSVTSGGSSSISKLWKGVNVTKEIPLSFKVVNYGGSTNLTVPSLSYQYRLKDPGGVTRASLTGSTNWSIPAMEVTTNTLVATLSVSSAVKLTNVSYTLEAVIDSGGQVSEALENNNMDAMTVEVNHYSGNLWFNNIKTDITITNWGMRTAGSSTAHWISGTGTLSNRTFSFNHLDVNKNLSTLDYTLTPTNPTVINVTFPSRYEIEDVTYWRENGVDLSVNGAYSDIRVLFPAGFGVSTNSATLMESTWTFSHVRLSQGLYPDTPLTVSGNFRIAEETKPVLLYATDMTWTPESGLFTFTRDGAVYVREGYYQILESKAGLMLDPEMAIKRANDSYYRGLAAPLTNPRLYAGTDGEALLTVNFGFDPVRMITHFPYNVEQAWGVGSELKIVDDLPSDASNAMKTPADITVPYARDCYGEECAGLVGDAAVKGSAISNTTVSVDGGLKTELRITGNGDLSWGTRWDENFAQKTDAFSDGTFYMPGHFIRGDLSAFDAKQNFGPALILFSGMQTNSLKGMERPGQSNYADGYADYAGVNVRVGRDGDRLASSIMGGEDTGWWDLTGRSKYYVRSSGVSGIHEAVPASFPSTLTIYDYQFKFTNYGLSYLSGQPEESRITGQVNVPYPCDISMQFEELMLSCLGELEEAQLADNSEKTLKYWDAVIQPLALSFAPTASSTCDNSARRLCLGLTTHCANIDQTLSGVLGLMPDGELGTPSDQIEGVPSRLAVPNEVELVGPGDEIYGFNPVAMPYYNSFARSGDSSSDRGWINFAGNLDVAFFSDLQVLFHTSASTNSGNAPVYMTGGWTDGSNTFFNSDPDQFDTANNGYPYGSVSYADFRNPTDDTYRARAQRLWLGMVNFDYPLQWSSSTKSFKSPDAETVDLMVLNVEHQTDYLSARNAEISFGLQYDGLPQINLANMAFNAVDEATGVASAFSDAVGEAVHQTIETGVAAMDDVLSDLPEKMFDPVFDAVLDPLIDDFYADLYAAYTNAPGTAYYGSVVTQYIYGVGAPAYQNVGSILSNLADSASMATNLIGTLQSKLDRANALINAFTDVVSVTPDGVALPEDLPGILYQQVDGQFGTLADLGVGVLSVLAETLYDSMSDSIEEQLNTAFESAAPSLEAITETMTELQSVITNMQAQLDVGASFANELSETLHSPLLLDPVGEICDGINAWFDSLPGSGTDFDEYSPEQVKALIRQKITDSFYGSVPCANVQQVIRSRLYDLDAYVCESIDSAFQQLNKALRDMVSQYVSGLDDQINGVLGDLSDVMGSGEVDGYAHIRDDSLTELRVDGKFQWKVPDEMEFNAYLIIRQLNSSSSGGCGVEGEVLPEVTIGTEGFGIAWLGSDIKADIAAKFAFMMDGDKPYLIGMGGSFEMVEGEIGFESFAISELYAAVAFGLLENYISANLRCEFTSYAVEGGAFFGKACSTDPFSWDPDVQSVLGDPPFTGVYVYGEGWMPIVDWGCLFRIKAGVGAGVFYFVDGPVGGKIFLGADGEALCVVNVSGDVTLVGLKDGDDFRMKGKGRISGRVGSCPFCVKFKKTVTVTYDNGDWDADY